MATPTIAVVETDPGILTLMTEELGRAGYQILPATTVSQAYRLIQRDVPDLIILDVRLDHPEGGWILFNVLRRDPATAHIPVIVCSGDIQFLDAIVDRLPEERCKIVEKPFEWEDLLEKIDQFIDPSRYGTDTWAGRSRS